jgi:hypothetical protein
MKRDQSPSTNDDDDQASSPAPEEARQDAVPAGRRELKLDADERPLEEAGYGYGV